jgi:hypothetical protein
MKLVTGILQPGQEMGGKVKIIVFLCHSQGDII